jgi:tRNA-specific 2-thiouridylase
MTKAEVREIARSLGLETAEKPESQEICFVPDGNYAGFVEKYAKYEMHKADDEAALAAGEITTVEGQVVGEHTGLHRYTVGQRRGIRISSPEPLYVVKIDVPRNQLVVGRRESLYKNAFTASGVNWLGIAPPAEPVRAAVRIRYRAAESMATITPLGEGRVRVAFDEAQAAITPGQAAVFYDDDAVVGGGWIQTVEE